MSQKIGTLRLALTFAGCFLGAGYVSGQELWQYFGAFGASHHVFGVGDIQKHIEKVVTFGVDHFFERLQYPFVKALAGKPLQYACADTRVAPLGA